MGSRLLDYVNAYVPYCDQKQSKARTTTFLELQHVLKAWVLNYGKQLGQLDKSLVEKHGARLLAFGGQRMGLVSAESDIDAICVVPCYVSRSTFFEKFPRALQDNPHATQLRVVEAAYVPVIKLTFQGIQFDLCLARLQMESIPEDLNVQSLDILRDMEMECIRSINGVRETLATMEILPDFELFAQAIKIVKHWAKSKRIYGSSMGFLGGIGWTLALAYCCQKHPGVSAPKLIQLFFHTLATWPWPQPILLKPLEDDILGLKPWNPRMNTGDLHHVMPIITPAYPQHNCAFTVLESTKTVIIKELQEACTVIDDIIAERLEPSALFNPPLFFTEFKHFLLVTSKAKSYQDHVDWSGLVEAKLRLFVSNLEKQSSIVFAHPCTKTFHPLVPNPTAFQSRWFIGLQFKQASGVNLDLAKDIKSFNDTLAHAAHIRKFHKTTMSIEVKHVKRKQLGQYVSTNELHSATTPPVPE